ncbi:MAG TPA: glycosyltransferase family 4 protein [Gemmatimonadales bacterium]
MRIVHVPRRFSARAWGGTETVVLELAVRQRGLGHDARIVTTTALDATSHEAMRGVPIERYPAFYPYLGLSAEARNQLDRKGGNLFSFAVRRRLLSGPAFEVLHLHAGKRLGGIGRQAAQRRGVPYVITLHGGAHHVPAAEVATWTAPTRGSLEWGKALGWWVGARRVLQDAAAVICLSPAEANAVVAEVPEARVEVIGNGVDAPRFAAGSGQRFRQRYALPYGVPVVAVIGRVDVQKGQLDAVRALAAIPHAHLVLAGPVTSESYAAGLVAEARQLGLEGRVTILPGFDPESQDLVDAYHAADVVMVPSRHEPFGVVVLEAWAAGRPVVATRVGGIPSFVTDREDALLVPPGDPGALSAAAAGLLASPALWEQLSLAGARTAARYSWDAVTARHLALYDALRVRHRRAA